MSAVLRALIVSIAVAISARPALGQVVYASPDITVTPPPGWSLTPAVGVSQTWDDNVTLKGPGDNPVSDQINVINPRAELNYNSPRGQLAARYDGAFLRYRTSSTLDAYEQHGSLAAKRRLSTRNSVFINGGVASAPTTELLQLTAVPFVRAGSRTEDARAGIESQLTKRLSIVADAHVQEVKFDENSPFANLLLGGTSVGGGAVLRERLSERTTLTADYDMQRASIGERHDIFIVQNGTVGLERALTEHTRISAGIGVARLDADAFGPPKTGPSWRAGFSHDLGRSLVEVLVYRSFVPSWSFGGTTQNQEATAKLRVPLSRRVYTSALVSWRHEDPLIEITPPLRSVWIQGTVGYAPNSWVRFEGYYFGTRQTVVAPDALLAHDQFGFQIIASKPVRLR